MQCNKKGSLDQLGLGKFQIKRKTRRDRMRAKLKMVQEEMRRRMHQPTPDQGKWLYHVVSAYFTRGIPNRDRPTLAAGTYPRRSERTKLNWEQMKQLIETWLPQPRILTAGARGNSRPYRDRQAKLLRSSYAIGIVLTGDINGLATDIFM